MAVSNEEFKGSLVLPSEQESQNATLVIDVEANTVAVRFDEAVAGATEWKGSDVKIVKRLKYHEVVFLTTDIPQETVELTWKCNAELGGGSLAGVIIARPNNLRITGEKGFIMVGEK